MVFLETEKMRTKVRGDTRDQTGRSSKETWPDGVRRWDVSYSPGGGSAWARPVPKLKRPGRWRKIK